jgi:hypothetical protein
MIRRLALCAVILGLSSVPALAQPKVGDVMSLVPTDYPKLNWSFGTPSQNDAAGKVVIHWFCTPKVSLCIDDLARIVTLRENGGVYVVASINASARDAKKIDPIRESEGVGRGAVASGPGVKALFKKLGIAKGPWSVVVDVDGTVRAVTTSGDINELDARDVLVEHLIADVRNYVVATDGPKVAQPNEKLEFGISIKLASWHSFAGKTPMEFTLTAAKEVRCNARTLKGDQLKIEGKLLKASVTCTAPKGVYQARGELRFGYTSLSGATGLGAESATWSFEIKSPAAPSTPGVRAK